MKLFKRDKGRKGASTAAGAGAGAPTAYLPFSDELDDQRYMALDSPTGPNFSLSPPPPPPPGAGSSGFGSADGGVAGSRSRSRSRSGYRGLFGGGKSKKNGKDDYHNNTPGRERDSRAQGFLPVATDRSALCLAVFPATVLARVFAMVCPHSQDRSYERCEDSGLDDTCMLCDMRDLAHCVQVCRGWRHVAREILYTSIRIDSVHYCDREAILAEKRKRRSFFDRNGEPEDTADARLKLLCRTLRRDATYRLNRTVEFLKLPYMLRESKHADMARAVALMPSLRYIDLPEGLFLDDPIYLALKLEIQANCPDLRKMTYMGGAERSLEALASGTFWRQLEVLELVRIGIDPALLRRVLASLPNLRAVKVTETVAGPGAAHSFTDDVLFSPAPSAYNGYSADLYDVPSIPPLEELVLTGTSSLTEQGLLAYLDRPDAGPALKVLTLSGTGVKPWSLQAVLQRATSLRHLTVIDEVSLSLPIAATAAAAAASLANGNGNGSTQPGADILPLASTSLQTLNYEIVAAKGVSPYAGVTRSYYNYLSGSILSGGFPNLRAVYVRDADFPDSLLGLPPPPPRFGGGGGGMPRPASSGAASFSSPLASPQSWNSAAPLHQRPTTPQFSGASPAGPGLSSNPFADGPGASANLKPWISGSNGGSSNPRFSSNNPFASMIKPQNVQTLEVFTKGDDDLDWSSIVVGSDGNGAGGASLGEWGAFMLGSVGHGGGGSSSRPASSYGLGGTELGGVGARRSVFINTGTGGFLAVPPDMGGGQGGNHGRSKSHDAELWPRPQSSSGRKSEKRDLWR